MRQKGFSPLIIILVIAILGVVGYFAYKNYISPKGTILGPYSPSPIDTATPNLTANWKTYTNDTYGFSFEYPGDYSYSESPQKDSAYFAPNQYKTSDITALPVITFAMLQFPDSVNNLQDELNQIKISDPNEIQNVKNIVVNGSQAIQFNELRGNELDTQILLKTKINGNSIFLIKLTDYDKADNNMLRVYSQILSTFKFTQ